MQMFIVKDEVKDMNEVIIYQINLRADMEPVLLIPRILMLNQ